MTYKRIRSFDDLQNFFIEIIEETLIDVYISQKWVASIEGRIDPKLLEKCEKAIDKIIEKRTRGPRSQTIYEDCANEPFYEQINMSNCKNAINCMILKEENHNDKIYRF